jgi:hypothetical protein
MYIRIHLQWTHSHRNTLTHVPAFNTQTRKQLQERGMVRNNKHKTDEIEQTDLFVQYRNHYLVVCNLNLTKQNPLDRNQFFKSI